MRTIDTCALAQSCLTLCDPMDCSPPGSSVYGVFQATVLEWGAISSSRGSSWPRDPTHISCGSCIDRRFLSPLSHLRSPYTIGALVSKRGSLQLWRSMEEEGALYFEPLPTPRVSSTPKHWEIVTEDPQLFCSQSSLFPYLLSSIWASQAALVAKSPPAKAGDIGDSSSTPGSRGFPGEGNGYPPQYSCLENSMGRGAWRAMVHGVTKSWTWLKCLSTHT